MFLRSRVFQTSQANRVPAPVSSAYFKSVSCYGSRTNGNNTSSKRMETGPERGSQRAGGVGARIESKVETTAWLETVVP